MPQGREKVNSWSDQHQD
jgi:hypothetical protein